VTAIRFELANILRAAALSTGIALASPFALTAAAQTTPSKPAPSKSAPAKPTPPKKSPAKAEAAKVAPAKAVSFETSVDEVDPAQPIADDVVDLAAWVIASGDNRGLPFAVIDKGAAQVLIFGENGKLRGLAPALIGSAVGDDSAPGVGDRELKDIPMKDRTTPAGRFLAAYGPAAGNQRVLWVDYETAISIHPLADNSAPKERRKERLASADPDDNRITHGCINVSKAFYAKVVNPTFEKGGIFYVLPDNKTMQAAFPAFDQRTFVASATEANKTSNSTLVAR
jgi:hypothetical protein